MEGGGTLLGLIRRIQLFLYSFTLHSTFTLFITLHSSPPPVATQSGFHGSPTVRWGWAQGQGSCLACRRSLGQSNSPLAPPVIKKKEVSA